MTRRATQVVHVPSTMEKILAGVATTVIGAGILGVFYGAVNQAGMKVEVAAVKENVQRIERRQESTDRKVEEVGGDVKYIREKIGRR